MEEDFSQKADFEIDLANLSFESPQKVNPLKRRRESESIIQDAIVNLRFLF